jgi:hypothetical protein
MYMVLLSPRASAYMSYWRHDRFIILVIWMGDFSIRYKQSSIVSADILYMSGDIVSLYKYSCAYERVRGGYRKLHLS